jgi:hypothetical protein
MRRRTRMTMTSALPRCELDRDFVRRRQERRQ